MSKKRHTGFVAIILSMTMVCAVLLTSFVPSDILQKTYICYEDISENSGISQPLANASLIPKPIKEASFEEAVCATGWIKSEKLGVIQVNSVFCVPVRFADAIAVQTLGFLNYNKLLCRLLI